MAATPADPAGGAGRDIAASSAGTTTAEAGGVLSSVASFPLTFPTMFPNVNRQPPLWAKPQHTDSGGGAIPMFPRLPRVLRARKHGPLTRPAPLVRMPSSQVGPLAQGPTSLVKGSRASGSADEVLVIALAALTYDKRCGGEDQLGHSLEDLMRAVEDLW